MIKIPLYAQFLNQLESADHFFDYFLIALLIILYKHCCVWAALVVVAFQPAQLHA